MAVVARSAVTYDHITSQVIAASPGIAANVPDGDTFPNGGSSILTMNNTGGSSYYVDVFQAAGLDGLPAVARRHTVAAGVIQRVKLGPPSIYGSVTKVVAENTAVKLMVEAL